MKTLNVNMPAALRASDMPDAQQYAIVRSDCETFTVQRFYREGTPGLKIRPYHYYLISNKTHFHPDGFKVALSVADVRKIIKDAR